METTSEALLPTPLPNPAEDNQPADHKSAQWNYKSLLLGVRYRRRVTVTFSPLHVHYMGYQNLLCHVV